MFTPVRCYQWNDHTGRVHDGIRFDPNPVRWDRAAWAEGDGQRAPIVYLFEFNRVGQVLRQIELAGPMEEPIAASSLAEFWAAQAYKRQPATAELVAYESIYGGISEGTLDDFDADYSGVQISATAFNARCNSARDYLSRNANGTQSTEA